jgi:hypothetical protein
VSLPVPEVGLFIRYSYLWKSEAEQGREEGGKDRPCAIVLVLFDQADRQLVRVLPITHTAPRDLADAMEIPQTTKKRLGLDSERSWIVVSEANDFVWPGPDLRAVPGKGLESVAHGFLPPKLLRAVQELLAERYRVHRRIAVIRSE